MFTSVLVLGFIVYEEHLLLCFLNIKLRHVNVRTIPLFAEIVRKKISFKRTCFAKTLKKMK